VVVLPHAQLADGSAHVDVSRSIKSLFILAEKLFA
jgi:hypothetical protein